MKKKITWICIAVVVFLCIVFVPVKWWTCSKHQHHYHFPDTVTLDSIPVDSIPVDSVLIDSTYVIDSLE